MGTVDVALEKGGIPIACELSVTTTPDHKFLNLKKYLAACFSYLVQIVTDPKELTALVHAARKSDLNLVKRVRFLLLIGIFDGISLSLGVRCVVHAEFYKAPDIGYRVCHKPLKPLLSSRSETDLYRCGDALLRIGNQAAQFFRMEASEDVPQGCS